MRLDNMILTDFAAAVVSPINSNGEQTTRGTITSVDPNDDKNVEVLIDGTHGGQPTAATTMVKCSVDDRVMVLIKNHKATVIGNISSPVLKKVTANDIEAGAVTAESISGTWFYDTDHTSWINLKLGTFNLDNKLIWNGTNLTVNGTLTAGAGSTIGPWTVSATSIYKISSAWGNATAGAAYFGNDGISITDKFKVNAAGALTSISGSIGGWNIQADKLTKTYNDGSSSITIDLNPTYGLNIKNNTGNDDIRVTSDGIWGVARASGSSTVLETFQLTPNTFNMTSYATTGSPQTWITGYQVRTDGDITAGGVISEGGTTLAQKYMGMEVANGYWGLKPNGSNAVYVRTTQNGLIPYQSGGSGTLGTSSWPFNTIYGKTIYENGTALSSKYLGLGGGTVSGAIIASYNGAMIRASNPTYGNIYAGLHAASGGNVGVYTNGYWNGSALTGSGRWLIYRNTANNTCVESQLYTHNEGYTTMRPVVGTNAGTNAVGVIVSNSATFGIYGRWAGGATAAMSGRTISCPSSDIRLKENVEDSTVDALSVINAIKIRQFDWKDKSRGHWDCGMVVDEMEKDIDPKFCIGGEDDEDGTISYKSVDTFYLQGYEVKAIQELSARIEELERRLNE